jgi:hypothetical protein
MVPLRISLLLQSGDLPVLVSMLLVVPFSIPHMTKSDVGRMIDSVVLHIMLLRCLQEGSAEFVGYGDAVLTQLLAGGWQRRRHGLCRDCLLLAGNQSAQAAVQLTSVFTCLVQQS